MKNLFKGVKQFSSQDFLHYKNLFQKLEKKQTPHTLFIGCSDSRIVPSLITKTLPGELFVIRNIANIVPFYRESDEFLSTTSAIEYAVKILNVSNIIVCGHSNCGGCSALYLDDVSLNDMPNTKKWLELMRPVKQKIENDQELMKDIIKKEWVTEQLNIIEQMNHLLTYPYIIEKYNNGKIKIFGWYYIIQSGEVYNYNKEKNAFIRIK